LHATNIHMSKEHNVCCSIATECMQQFNSREELIKHWILTSHIYYCHICVGGLLTKHNLVTHPCGPRKDAIVGGIKCPVCRMMAPDQETYDKHWEDTAQDSRHFRCKDCHQVFAEENALRQVYRLLPTQRSITNHLHSQHAQVHRPATVLCSLCHKSFSSHSDLFRHMEVACRYINKQDLHDRLLSLPPHRSCALPTHRDEQLLFFCRGCERRFDDLGSWAAHVEQSRACPARVDSEYFRGIVEAVNGREREQVDGYYLEEWD